MDRPNVDFCKQCLVSLSGHQDDCPEATKAETPDQAEDHCMCGNPMEGHGWHDGHSPVSQADYHRQGEEDTYLPNKYLEALSQVDMVERRRYLEGEFIIEDPPNE